MSYLTDFNGYENWETYQIALIIMNDYEYYQFLMSTSDSDDPDDSDRLEYRLKDVLASISLDDTYGQIDLYKVNEEQIIDLLEESIKDCSR